MKSNLDLFNCCNVYQLRKQRQEKLRTTLTMLHPSLVKKYNIKISKSAILAIRK
jgi:hypothetical protein